ncbi:E3 SUMO-protein ligase ZBED1-like [Discoglossus pictus]
MDGDLRSTVVQHLQNNCDGRENGEDFRTPHREPIERPLPVSGHQIPHRVKEKISMVIHTCNMASGLGSATRRKREKIASIEGAAATLAVIPRKSKVWNYYTKLGDAYVECNVCRKQMLFNNSTTTMREHLVRWHSIRDTGIPQLKEEPKSDFPNQEGASKRLRHALPDNDLCHSESGARAEVIADLVLQMIFHDLHSFSILEDKGFGLLLGYLEPGFSLPSPLQLSSMLFRKYTLLKQQLKCCLQTASSIVLSVEHWTGHPNQPYLGIRANFIDDKWNFARYMLETHHLHPSKAEARLAERLHCVLVEFGIPTKVVSSVVHDHSASLYANTQSLKDAHGWTSLCCSAHILQLCVHAGLEIQEVREALGSARGLVSLFQQDIKAKCLLTGKLESMNKPKLVLDTELCWLTTLEMCEALLDLKFAILSVMEEQGLQTLTNQHWKLLQDLVPILRTVRIATSFLREEQNASVSSLMPCIYGILMALDQLLNQSSGIIKAVAGQIRSEILKHWDMLDEEKLLANPAVVASFFDPRFKELRFLKPRVREELHSQIKEIIIQMYELLSPSEVQPPPLLCCVVAGIEESFQLAVQKDRDNDGFESIYDILLGKDPTENMPEVHQQLENYIVEPICKRTTDPLVWWKDNCDRFPALAKLARRYLAAPATAIHPKRSFAVKQNILDQRRATLDPIHMDQILFLHQNVNLLPK